MPKFAANLSMMFGEVPFLERFAAARQAGFDAVEYLLPYAWDRHELAEQLDTHGLSQVLHNLPAGNWDAGDRGLGCLPGRESEFQESVGRAIEYATALGCPRVNCLAGIAPDGVSRDRLMETFVENLRFAAPAFEAAGVQLLIEPINGRDMPGYFLNRVTDGLDVLTAANTSNLYVQADLYHMHVMNEDVPQVLTAHLDRIKHLQLADHPGRHEPGTGTIDFATLFALLDRGGYDGWIGCEYRPATTTGAGLGWIDAFR